MPEFFDDRKSSPRQIPRIPAVMEVIVRDLKVYREASLSSGEINRLPKGARIEADLNSRAKADGFIWIQHLLGWSTERAIDRGNTFMKLAAPGALPTIPSPARKRPLPLEAPQIIRKMRALDEGIRIRKVPAISGEALGKLRLGEVVEVDLNSRTKADGFVWIRHDRGWSAERAIDRSQVFLELFAPPKPPPGKPDGAGKTRLMAALRLRTRLQPSVDAPENSGEYLTKGEVIEVSDGEIARADGFIWVKHTKGWTVWRTEDNREHFLVEIGSLPGVLPIIDGKPDLSYLPGFGQLIERLPVRIEDTRWFQYFGNNVFAYENGARYGYDEYAQGLHAGLDFGNSHGKGIPVFAGIRGNYWRTLRPSFGNEQVWVTGGDYIFIYQHLINSRPFPEGAVITPDTVIGEIHVTPGFNHLHLEIRYQRKWLVNPLLLIPEKLVGEITGKFDPAMPRLRHKSQLRYFFKNERWNRWTTPYDQPAILWRGPLIGPRAASI